MKIVVQVAKLIVPFCSCKLQNDHAWQRPCKDRRVRRCDLLIIPVMQPTCGHCEDTRFPETPTALSRLLCCKSGFKLCTKDIRTLSLTFEVNLMSSDTAYISLIAHRMLAQVPRQLCRNLVRRSTSNHWYTSTTRAACSRGMASDPFEVRGTVTVIDSATVLCVRRRPLRTGDGSNAAVATLTPDDVGGSGSPFFQVGSAYVPVDASSTHPFL